MLKRFRERAAVLLFHPDPERYFTGAAVKIGYFSDESDLRYHDEVTGDLFTQVNTIMELLLTKYLKAAIGYEGIHRIESYPMPETALREAVLNAVVHRDYADRLRIWNPGELPEGWSEASLLGPHSSRPYNPDVANAFFRAGEIEAWGRGIERIFQACDQAGTPKPRIQVEHRDIWFEFPFSEAYRVAITDGNRRTPDDTTQKTSVRIIELLRENPNLTLAEIAEIIGKSKRAVEMASSKLVKEQRLRYVGPQKGGHWEILEDSDE